MKTMRSSQMFRNFPGACPTEALTLKLSNTSKRLTRYGSILLPKWDASCPFDAGGVT
jgi:hypothetical protein